MKLMESDSDRARFSSNAFVPDLLAAQPGLAGVAEGDMAGAQIIVRVRGLWSLFLSSDSGVPETRAC